MTRWDDLPPTGAQLWLYRHRTALRVIGVLGLLAAVALTAVRLAADRGTVAVLASLGGVAGFGCILMSVHALKRAVEGDREHRKGQG